MLHNHRLQESDWRSFTTMSPQSKRRRKWKPLSIAVSIIQDQNHWAEIVLRGTRAKRRSPPLRLRTWRLLECLSIVRAWKAAQKYTFRNQQNTSMAVRWWRTNLKEKLPTRSRCWSSSFYHCLWPSTWCLPTGRSVTEENDYYHYHHIDSLIISREFVSYLSQILDLKVSSFWNT